MLCRLQGVFGCRRVALVDKNILKNGILVPSKYESGGWKMSGCSCAVDARALHSSSRGQGGEYKEKRPRELRCSHRRWQAILSIRGIGGAVKDGTGASDAATVVMGSDSIGDRWGETPMSGDDRRGAQSGAMRDVRAGAVTVTAFSGDLGATERRTAPGRASKLVRTLRRRI